MYHEGKGKHEGGKRGKKEPASAEKEERRTGLLLIEE